MERKYFLKSLLIGAAGTTLLGQACKKDSATSGSSSSTTTGSNSSTGTSVTSGTTTSTSGCQVIPTETEGPYPTKSPASYVRSDIRDDRDGYKLTVNIIVNNSNNNCNALAGALVDIWHCDKDGNYSEYGTATNQSLNFLRGRQTTDANGKVTFTTIFPGWYNGRATHIHVHIFNAAGTTLKVTQIAFPEGTGTALAAVNGYSKGLTGYTTNAQDGIFSDGYSLELAAVSGNTTDGFVLTIAMSVPA